MGRRSRSQPRSSSPKRKLAARGLLLGGSPSTRSRFLCAARSETTVQPPVTASTTTRNTRAKTIANRYCRNRSIGRYALRFIAASNPNVHHLPDRRYGSDIENDAERDDDREGGVTSSFGIVVRLVERHGSRDEEGYDADDVGRQAAFRRQGS